MVAGIVGRKKKDADRVNYNISRRIRNAVIKEADRVGSNEIDAIEDLLRIGLAAKNLLKQGKINYVELEAEIDRVFSPEIDEE